MRCVSAMYRGDVYTRKIRFTYILIIFVNWEICRLSEAVSMTPEYRFPLKQNCGFLYIGAPVFDLRNEGVNLLVREYRCSGGAETANTAAGN